MEEAVKKYMTKLMISGAVAGALFLVLGFSIVIGILAIIILPTIAYFYVKVKSKNPEWVKNLTSPGYGISKKMVGVKIISFLAIIVFAALAYMSRPKYTGDSISTVTYTYIGLAVLSLIVFVWTFLKKKQ